MLVPGRLETSCHYVPMVTSLGNQVTPENRGKFGRYLGDVLARLAEAWQDYGVTGNLAGAPAKLDLSGGTQAVLGLPGGLEGFRRNFGQNPGS